MSVKALKKYDEVESIKSKFLKKVANLSNEQLNKIPANGGWSIGQVLYHCAFAESGTILAIKKNLDEGKVQLKSDIGGLFRNMFLTASLRSPLKFKAPRVVSSVPETITMDEIKKYFAKNSVDFKKLLQDLPAELEDKFIFKHPRAGLFSIDHTINFTREHYLHHERQLNALL